MAGDARAARAEKHLAASGVSILQCGLNHEVKTSNPMPARTERATRPKMIRRDGALPAPTGGI